MSFLSEWIKRMLNLQQKFARETRAILLTRVAAGITKSTDTTQSACLHLGVLLAALVTNSTRSSLWQAATGDDDSGFGSFDVADVDVMASHVDGGDFSTCVEGWNRCDFP